MTTFADVLNLFMMKKSTILALLMMVSATAMALTPWKKGAFETGQYRNLLGEMGYSQADVDAKLKEVFNDVFRGPNKVYFEVGDSMGYVSDVKNDVDVGMVLHCLHEPTLNFCSRVVGMVEDAELRMTAFAVEVELTIALLVEIDSPVDQFGDLLRCHTHHLFYGSAVGNVVARYHRVFDVLVEIVNFQVGHTGNTALRKGGVRLIEGCLANEANLTFMGTCHLQSVTHTGDASTNDEEVVLVGHRGCIFSLLRYFGMTGCCYFGMAVYRYDVWEWKASSRERELEIETEVVGGRGVTVGSEERFIHLHVVEETHGDKPTQRVVC